MARSKTSGTRSNKGRGEGPSNRGGQQANSAGRKPRSPAPERLASDFRPGRELVFCALGGSGEIGMNVNLYGCDGAWLMVDLGMTFGANEYPGTELVFADLSFIEAQRRDLIGIVLTHAHEDHIGAVPYFAAELGVPLYATPFTARLVALKLEEAGVADKVKLIVIDHEDAFHLGPFAIRYVPLAHSIAEGNALVIDTPYGKVFHTGDWKLDDEPLVGTPATPGELSAIGDDGVLALVCDSTNVFNSEASGSEGEVARALLAEVRQHSGRVLITTFASNVARLHTLGAVARATGRQLCVAGRSLDRIIATARACGYLRDLPKCIGMHEAMALPRHEVLILATGGQGEPRAALARIADEAHPITLEAGDSVLFSSRQIPGNEIAIARIQNQLAARGIHIVTDRQSDIHVSGHPGRPELVKLYSWLRPEILVPVHGEIRHMREQARLGRACGIPVAIDQANGDLVRLAPGRPGRLARVRAGRLLLDGDIIAPADGEAMVARRRLARDGVVMVAVAGLSGRAQVRIEALGLPLIEDYPHFLDEAIADVESALARLKGPARRDAAAVTDVVRLAVRLAVRRVAQAWSGKKPQVEVLVLDSKEG